jgi:hypothetical protein
VGHADGAGSDAGNLHDNHVIVTVRPVGDVSVVLAESADPIQVGTSFDYTATVSNLGPDAGTAHLAVTLSGGSVAVVTPTNGTCTSTSSSVNCDFASLASGATGTAIIALTTTAAGTATAAATVTFDGTDPVSTNNTASASTTVNAPPPPPAGSGNNGGGGGGGGGFDWLAIGLLGLLAGRRLKMRRAADARAPRRPTI